MSEMVEYFERELGVNLSPSQRALLERENSWYLAHGEWGCRSIMAADQEDVRCVLRDGHAGAHRGSLANGASHVWGDSEPGGSENG